MQLTLLNLEVETLPISYVTCVAIIAQVSLANSMINIIIFRCVDPETLDYYYCFAYRPTRNNSPDYQYNKKLSCLCLMRLIFPWINFSGFCGFICKSAKIYLHKIWLILLSTVTHSNFLSKLLNVARVKFLKEKFGFLTNCIKDCISWFGISSVIL